MSIYFDEARAELTRREKPNDFFEERYSLRQVLYDPPRRTELFITLTMYNVSLPSLCSFNGKLRAVVFDDRKMKFYFVGLCTVL